MANAKNTQLVAATTVAPPRQLTRREVLGMFAGAFALAAGGPLLEACSKGGRRQAETYERQMQRLLLPEWRSAAAKFEGREYAVLSNLKAFSELGKAMTESERGKAFLSGKRELTILYPGAGEHLSPLEFVMRLADGAPGLGKVRLIYTEICKDCYERIDKDVEAVMQTVPGLGNLSVQVKEDCNPGKEKTMRFSYAASSGRKVQVELLFAMERGGEDGAYYRSEYFQSADILLSHDSIGSEGGRSPGLAVQMFAGSLDKEGGGSKGRVLLMEYDQGNPYERHLLYEGLGNADVVDAPFGCGPNHLERSKTKMLRPPFFNHAAAIYLDTELFRKLSAHGLMDAYGKIMTFVDSDLSEPMQLQTGEGYRTQEKTDGYRKAYNSDLAVLLKGLPALSPSARAKLSRILLTSMGGSFNLDIFSDETTLPGLRMVARDYLDSYSGYDINGAIQSFMMFRSDHFLDFQNHMFILLACYLVASKAGDAELLAKVKSVVQYEFSRLDKGSISEILGGVVALREIADDPRSRGMPIGASLKFSQDGLFLIEARGIETPLGMTAQAIMTLLSLANKLRCDGIEEMRQFISDETGGHPRAQAYGEWFYQAASE